MNRKEILGFYAVAFGFSWLLWIPAALASRSPTAQQGLITPLLLIGTFGPLISAAWSVWTKTGYGGVLQLLETGCRWRFSWKIYAMVLVLPAAVAAAGYYFAGGREPNVNLLVLVETFVLYFFLGGSFAEEFGWRGFALPRLQRQFGSIGASLIVGFLWAMWHIPLFWIKGTSQNQSPFWLFMVGCIAISLIMTWAYNSSGGSVLTALLFHTSWNTMSVVCPPVLKGGDVDLSVSWATAGMVAAAIAFIALGSLRRDTSGSANATYRLQ